MDSGIKSVKLAISDTKLWDMVGFAITVSLLYSANNTQHLHPDPPCDTAA